MNEPVDSRKTKERSPNFPFIPLNIALARADAFYRVEKRGAAPVAAVAEHWNYSLKSSGLLQTIAALKSYGLMIDEGRADQRRLKLSDLALRILLDTRPNSEEKDNFLREAALNPAVLRIIYENWRDNAPSDPTLNHFLIFEMNFSPAAALDVIKIFKENESLVGIYEPLNSVVESSEIKNIGDSKAVEIQTKAVQGQQASVRLNEVDAEKQIGSIKVSANCLMSINAEGIVTQAGLTKLIAYINLIKDSFPEKEEAIQPLSLPSAQQLLS